MQATLGLCPKYFVGNKSCCSQLPQMSSLKGRRFLCLRKKHGIYKAWTGQIMKELNFSSLMFLWFLITVTVFPLGCISWPLQYKGKVSKNTTSKNTYLKPPEAWTLSSTRVQTQSQQAGRKWHPWGETGWGNAQLLFGAELPLQGWWGEPCTEGALWAFLVSHCWPKPCPAVLLGWTILSCRGYYSCSWQG